MVDPHCVLDPRELVDLVFRFEHVPCASVCLVVNRKVDNPEGVFPSDSAAERKGQQTQPRKQCDGTRTSLSVKRGQQISQR